MPHPTSGGAQGASNFISASIRALHNTTGTGTPGFLINNAPEIPDVEEALAQTRQLIARSFSPKPFGGALATSPFGLAAPAAGSIGKRRVLTGSNP